MLELVCINVPENSEPYKCTILDTHDIEMIVELPSTFHPVCCKLVMKSKNEFYVVEILNAEGTHECTISNIIKKYGNIGYKRRKKE